MKCERARTTSVWLFSTIYGALTAGDKTLWRRAASPFQASAVQEWIGLAVHFPAGLWALIVILKMANGAARGT